MLDFESFYLGTAQRLMRFAYGLTGDLAEAQDFTQEAYARAFQRWRRLRRYDNPEGWLRLVVTCPPEKGSPSGGMPTSG